MKITCPRCHRTYEGNLPSNPEIIIRCRLCSSPFTLNDLKHARPTAPPKVSVSKAPEDVWEFSMDEIDQGHNTTTTPSPFDDFAGDPFGDIEEDPFGDIEEDFEELTSFAGSPQIPDLPQAPAAMESLIDNLSRSSQLNDAIVPDEVSEMPELPQLEELQEAPLNDPIGDAMQSFEEPSEPEFSLEEPSPEQGLDDLLQMLNESGGPQTNHYTLRRGDRTFGPFSEDEIHTLLRQRKLSGDEPTARVGQEETWKPLRRWNDFSAMVEMLEARDEAKASAPPTVEEPPPPAPNPPPTPSVEEELEPIVIPKSSASQKAPAWRQYLLLLLLLILILGGAWWFLANGDQNPSNETPSSPCKPSDRFLYKQLTLKDRYNYHMRNLRKLEELQRTKTNAICLPRLHFVYGFLDSYGKDPELEQRAQRIYSHMTLSKYPPRLRWKLQMSRSLAIGTPKQQQEQLAKAPKFPHGRDVEYDYLTARALEKTNPTRALTLYRGILKQHNKHVRAALRAHSITRYLKQQKQAQRFLLQAKRARGLYAPTLLAELEAAFLQKAKKGKIKRIERKLKQIEDKQQLTRYQKSQWHFLRSGYAWLQQNSDQALLEMDRAVGIAPKRNAYRKARILLYLEEKQGALVLRFLDQEKNPKEALQVWRWRIQALLQANKQKEAQALLETLQKKEPKTTEQIYSYHLAQGLIQLHHKQPKQALASYTKALRAAPGQKEALYWLAQVYYKQKQYDQCSESLRLYLLDAHFHPRRKYSESLAKKCKKLAPKNTQPEEHEPDDHTTKPKPTKKAKTKAPKPRKPRKGNKRR